MPRPLRRLLSEEFYFVTNRTFEQRFFFKPGKKVNQIIGRCLAKAVAQYHIEVYSFCFMANHFHLVLRAPRGHLSEFMACFQSMLAKDLNRHYGRHGPMFQRRFVATPILDEGALVERMVYTLNNPVKAGLVGRARHYEGLHSYAQTFGKAPRVFRWLDRTRWWQAGRPNDVSAFEVAVPLKVQLLPTPWRDILRKELLDDALRLQAERAESGKRLPSSKRLRALRASDRPNKSSNRRPQPRCHTTQPSLREAFDEMWHCFVQAFRSAADKVANKQWRKAIFPLGSFPPTRYPVQFDPGPAAVALLSL